MNNKLPGLNLLRPVIVVSASGKERITFYQKSYNSELTINEMWHKAGWDEYVYYPVKVPVGDITNPITTAKWAICENVFVNNIDEATAWSVSNYTLWTPSDNQTATHTGTRTVLVKALGPIENELGTIYSYSDTHESILCHYHNQAIPESEIDLNNTMTITGVEGSYAGPLHAVKLRLEFDSILSSTKQSDTPAAQGSITSNFVSAALSNVLA